MVQIYSLSSRIYSDSTAKCLLRKLLNNVKMKFDETIIRAEKKFRSKHQGRPLFLIKRSGNYLLSLASSLFFYWEKEGISDQEINSTLDEFFKISNSKSINERLNHQNHDMRGAHNNSNNNNCNHDSNGSTAGTDDDNSNHHNQSADSDDSWEAIIVRNNYQVWRKSVPNTSLYQYKSMYGS